MQIDDTLLQQLQQQGINLSINPSLVAQSGAQSVAQSGGNLAELHPGTTTNINSKSLPQHVLIQNMGPVDELIDNNESVAMVTNTFNKGPSAAALAAAAAAGGTVLTAEDSAALNSSLQVFSSNMLTTQPVDSDFMKYLNVDNEKLTCNVSS